MPTLFVLSGVATQMPAPEVAPVPTPPPAHLGAPSNDPFFREYEREEQAASAALHPAVGSTTVQPLTKSADSTPELTWDRAWARAGTLDYVVTGGAAALSIGLASLKPPRDRADKYLLFDRGARDALAFDNVRDRYRARDASDVLLSLETTWPLFVDSIIVAYGTRKSPDVAWEMAVIDAEALAISAALHQATTAFVGRPRPYVTDCGNLLPQDANDCVRSSRFRSFYSGHTSLAFTGASLICAHRAHHALFGGGWDTATCVTAYVAAAATGALRIMGDVHHATDVVAGALIGTAVGLGIPALHYRRRDRSVVDVNVYPTGAGVGLAVRY